jgi:hypothetical protein
MTHKKTPPDWVLIEAAKRSGWGDDVDTLRSYYANYDAFSALCDMIERHERPPVDRKLLCAREAASEHGYDEWDEAVDACRRAIELWEEEFGK